MIYLDSNAAMPIKPAVRAAMSEAMERHGNPSSAHRYGRIARRYMEDARAKIAALAGAKASEVIMTGSGSDANMLILGAFAERIVSAIEHDSVLAFASADRRIPVLKDGRIDVYAAESLLKKAPKGSLVSVMLVNNDTGVIQPMAVMAYLAEKYGHFLHVDAAQAAGRMPLDFSAMGIHALTLSAHKIGGPQGVGALVVKNSLGMNPRIPSGENVAGVIGFGVAAQLAADDLRDTLRLQSLRDKLQRMIEAVTGGEALIIGHSAPRVANTLLVALPGVSGEAQVEALDLAGVAVGVPAACSSGNRKISRALKAMGYGSDAAACAARLSLGWHTKAKDIDRCAEAYESLYRRTRVSRTSKAA